MIMAVQKIRESERHKWRRKQKPHAISVAAVAAAPPQALLNALTHAKWDIVAALRHRPLLGAVEDARPPDYGLAFHERLRLVGEDGRGAESRLRALEAVVNLYRSHHPRVDFETAKATVLAAIKGSASA
jgi:hypothetical protein